MTLQALLLSAIATLPVSVPTTSQDPGAHVVAFESETGREIRMYRYLPKHQSPSSLVNAVKGVVGTHYQASDKEGRGDRLLANLQSYQDVILIFETAERVASVMETLELYEGMGNDESSMTRELEIMEYSPEYMSVSSMMEALRPFSREITIAQEGGLNKLSNITTIPGRGAILIREFHDNLNEIRALMARIDTPVPQVVITSHLVQGSNSGEGSELPAELVNNLKRLLPFKHYKTISVGVLRTSVSPDGDDILLVMSDVHGRSYRLEMEPQAYEARTGSVSMRRVSFSVVTAHTNQLFSTSTQIRGGEYTVLGASGPDPLFVVLRIAPVDAKAN